MRGPVAGALVLSQPTTVSCTGFWFTVTSLGRVLSVQYTCNYPRDALMRRRIFFAVIELC